MKFGPEGIKVVHQIRTPLPHAGSLPLIEPAKVCPPESAMTRAGDVVDGIGVGVVIAMVGDPRTRRTGTVKYRKENQNLFNDGVQLHRSVRQCPVITDCGSEPAATRHGKSRKGNLPAGKRKKYESCNNQNMKHNEIDHHPKVISIRFPP